MRRYRLVVEVYEDDQLIRRMEESRNQLDNDYSDGEKTAGMLLSFVPRWLEADSSTGDGLTTLAEMCNFLPYTADEDVQLFKKLGKAYEDWGAAHSFQSCVEVRIDQERLECDAMECNHRSDSPSGGGADKARKYSVPGEWHQTEIGRSTLNMRTKKALYRDGIYTIDQLAKRSEFEILSLRGIGCTSWWAIDELLKNRAKQAERQ